MGFACRALVVPSICGRREEDGGRMGPVCVRGPDVRAGWAEAAQLLLRNEGAVSLGLVSAYTEFATCIQDNFLDQREK